MISQLNPRGFHYLLLIGIGLFTFFVNLGKPALWDLDEGKNSVCSIEMMRSNNWVIPTFNGKLRVDKPVLLYWLQILSYYSFGINEFSARLPSALAALMTVLLCYELARSMFGSQTGLLAGVVAATTPMLCGAARFANPDSLLNACTVLTLALFWFGATERRWWWFVSLGIASGLGMLAKGPVGWMLPSSVILLFLLWERQCSIYGDWRWLLTCGSFTLAAIPWYAWVGVDTQGKFLIGFLWEHNVERGISVMNEHAGFPGYYLAVLIAGTTPWSIFLLVSWWFGFWSAVRRPWDRWSGWWSRAAECRESDTPPPASVRRDLPAAYRLLACWVFVYCVFYTVAATKLPNYMLPVIVPCAILIARFAQRWQNQSLHLPNALIGVGLASLGLFGVGLTLGLAITSGLWEWPALRGRTVPGLTPWTLIGLIPLTAAILGWRFASQKKYREFTWTIAAAAFFLLGPLVAFGIAVFNHHKAPRSLVEQTQVSRQNEDIRIGSWHADYLPSLNFYAQRNVIQFEHEEDLPSFMDYPMPVYLVMPAQEWERLGMAGLGHVAARHRDMYQHTDIVVVSNRPK